MSGKILYIARHAKSSWDNPSLSDFERPLNNRGSKDASLMAEILAQKGISPQVIVSSPARRAKTTAEIYYRKLYGKLLLEERIYEASVMTLKYLADEYLQHYDRVMIVGHNPGMTALVESLSDADIYHLPTSAVVGIEFTEFQRLKGSVVLYEYPKKYK